MKKLAFLLLLLSIFNSTFAWKAWYRYVNADTSTIITMDIQSNAIEIIDQNKIDYKITMKDSVYVDTFEVFNPANSLIFSTNHSIHENTKSANVFMHSLYLPYQLKARMFSHKASVLNFIEWDVKSNKTDRYFTFLKEDMIKIMGQETKVLVYESGLLKKRKKKNWKYKDFYYFRKSDNNLLKVSRNEKKNGQTDIFLIKEKSD